MSLYFQKILFYSSAQSGSEPPLSFPFLTHFFPCSSLITNEYQIVLYFFIYFSFLYIKAWHKSRAEAKTWWLVLVLVLVGVGGLGGLRIEGVILYIITITCFKDCAVCFSPPSVIFITSFCTARRVAFKRKCLRKAEVLRNKRLRESCGI